VIRVLLISGICLYREGLAGLLGQSGRVEVAGAVETVEDGIELYRSTSSPPDVILLDTLRVDGVAKVRELRQALGDVHVLALTVPHRERDVIALAEAGIASFVTPDASTAQLIEAIESVARGEATFSPSMAAALVRRLAFLARDRSQDGARAGLTRREREIMELIGAGLSNKQIAQQLLIELPTVKNHVHHILGKLGVQRRTEAAAVVRNRRWDEPRY
jgi:two-component system, NarL family, nitrate/nitrite response regulator NarL